MSYVLIVLFWLVALYAFVSRGPVLLYLFFITIPLGSFAVVPAELTGGLTFTAQPILSLLLIARVLATKGGADFMLTGALRLKRMGLLADFWLVCLLTTAMMPFLFRGLVEVIPFRGDDLSEAVLLAPTVQNISQLTYLSISIFSIFALSLILRSKSDRQIALKALCWGAAVTVLTGLVDYATQYLPIEFLLTPFRTASYALLTDVEVMGGKRVIGLMPEASSYGSVSLAFLAATLFFRRAMVDPFYRNLFAPVVIVLTALFCFLSTSSATYLGLIILAVAFAGDSLVRAFMAGREARSQRGGLIGELNIIVGAIILIGFVALIQPDVLNPVYDLFDRMVLQKTDSASFEERGYWRATAAAAVWDTYGLGVGVGSTRSSSNFVAIFAATGVLGGLLFYGFVIQTLARGGKFIDEEGRRMISAFRLSYLPTFVLSLLIGGSNIGPLTVFGLGLVTAVAFDRNSQRLVQVRRVPRAKHRGRARPDYGPGIAPEAG